MCVLGAVILVPQASLSAQWFPDGPRSAAAEQLASQLREQKLAPNALSPDEFTARVRALIDAMATNIETLGVEGLKREAPVFVDIKMPPSDRPLLQLLNTYAMCTLPLHLELAVDDDQRLYVMVGEMAVMVVSAFLRHEYLESGGTDQEIKVAMTSERILALSNDVQVKQELRDHVSMTCAGPLAQITQ